MIVIANRRLDNAKSPAAMLQGKTAPTPAQTPHTLRVADVVSTYISQVGYYLPGIFFLLICSRCLYSCVPGTKKAKTHTAQQHSKNNEKNENSERGKKKPSPLVQ